MSELLQASAAINICVHVSFSIIISGIGPVVELLIIWCSSSCFLRNIHPVLHSGCINFHSYQQYKRVPFFSYPHQHLLFCRFWQHSDWCKVILHLIFIFISLHGILSIFSCAFAHLCVFTGGLSVWVFCPFFIGLFVFQIEPYDLHIYSANQSFVSFICNYLPHPEGYR